MLKILTSPRLPTGLSKTKPDRLIERVALRVWSITIAFLSTLLSSLGTCGLKKVCPGSGSAATVTLGTKLMFSFLGGLLLDSFGRLARSTGRTRAKKKGNQGNIPRCRRFGVLILKLTVFRLLPSPCKAKPRTVTDNELEA